MSHHTILRTKGFVLLLAVLALPAASSASGRASAESPSLSSGGAGSGILVSDQRSPLMANGSERALQAARRRLGGRVLFRGDFDAGNARRFRNTQAEPGRVTFGRRNPAPFEGSHRARFEVRPGDESAGGNRAEVTGPSFEEGDERWIRQAIYVPRGTATERGWRLVMQFHAFGGGSPPLAVFLDSGARPRFEVGHGDSSTFDWRGPRIQRNRWYDIALHVRFSPNPSEGFVEVYLNGRRQRLTNGRKRRYRATSEQGGAYYKTGIYRDDDIGQTDVIFHDNVLISAP